MRQCLYQFGGFVPELAVWMNSLNERSNIISIDPLALDFERSKGTVWVGNQLVDAGTTDGCKGKLEILD